MSAYDFQWLIVSPDTSLGEALRRMDVTGRGILLVVDAEGRLVRTLTDGDLRRAVLSQLPPDVAIRALSAQAPITVLESASAAEVLRLMDAHQIDHVPVLDAAGKPVDLVYRRELSQRIWLSSPHMGAEETALVADAFDSNWIAPLGPHVDGFEREMSAKVGVGHAAAMSSGTAALHVGLVLLGVQPGDSVFCSSFTFVASCNPIRYCGATPVFIDSEPGTWNLSPVALGRAFDAARKSGKLPRAVIIVNLYGQSADMDALLPICARYGVPVLEDAAESLGATYKNRSSGSFGHLGVFSFNGNKIITTSGGGMLVSNDAALIERARKLSTQARETARHYEHVELGYNYRMSNILAAIGRGQLKVLDERLKRRRAVFERYREALSDVPGLAWMPQPEGYRSTRWLSCFALTRPDAPASIQRMLQTLERRLIEARPLWKPMHLQPLFKSCTYFPHGESPGETSDVSARLFQTGMCLPSGSNMDEAQQDRVIEALRQVL